MENEESLQTCALISKFPDSIKHQVNNLLAYGVMSSRIVIRSVLFPSDKLLRVEQLAIGSCANFINHCWLKINKDCSRYMLSSPGLREERIKRVISSSNGFIRWHLSIRLDSMF